MQDAGRAECLAQRPGGVADRVHVEKPGDGLLRTDDPLPHGVLDGTVPSVFDGSHAADCAMRPARGARNCASNHDAPAVEAPGAAPRTPWGGASAAGRWGLIAQFPAPLRGAPPPWC
ncbi:hypothetical protein GCM10010359_10410 [Streptomyces morookaense]|nr:hypothetical protein GCM10010359_10410 [Streptomyces morookaense]